MSERLDAWRPAEDWRNGGRDVIDVVWCALRCSDDQLAAKHSLLTSVERARAARFRRDADRAAYIIMRAPLRERLAVCLGVTAMEVPLTEGAQGKPVLAMREPRWEFNVSHSGEAGLIAFAWGRAVGVDVEAQVNTDWGAAKSIVSRRGAVRVRHIEVRELWTQGRVAKGGLSVVKAKAEENVAEGLTKHADRQKMEQHMEACSVVRRSGRHELCPQFGDLS